MAVNEQNCELTQVGTALPDCYAELGYPKGFILTKKSWSESDSTTIDKEYIQTKIQEGVFIPFLNSTEFTDNTPDPTDQEFADGTKVNVRSGKPEFQFDFTKSYNFQKIAVKYNSFSKYNVILVFDNDSMLLAHSNGNLSGFNAGMIHTNTFSHNTGSEVGMTPTRFQLLDNKQYNNGGILTADFDLTGEINGVLDATLVASEDGTDVAVKVRSEINPLFDVLGLTVAEFSLLVNGAREQPSAVTQNADNSYTLTPTSTLTTSDTVVVELYDNANSLNTAKVGDLFYKGKSESITWS